MLFNSLNVLLQRVDQSEKVWLKGRGAKRAFYRQRHPEKDGFCVAVKTPEVLFLSSRVKIWSWKSEKQM